MSSEPKSVHSSARKPSEPTAKEKRPAAKSRDLLTGGERVKWKTAWKPSLVSRLSDTDLAAGKAAFFSMDRDSSGCIDEDELLQALRVLGHILKRDQIKAMITEVEGDHGDGDGKISMREFLAWYARCLQLKPTTDKDQMNDAFSSLGGIDGKLAKKALYDHMYDHFELEVDVDEAFETPAKDGELKYDDFVKLLQKQSA
jgi:Ca2+-binding EF-hand superfamily protein